MYTENQQRYLPNGFKLLASSNYITLNSKLHIDVLMIGISET